jgi:hypothetical protein
MMPNVGEMIMAKFSHVHVWDENLDDSIDELNAGEFMIVLATSHPTRKKRLNPNLYRKVLTQSARVGWVHLDNCSEVDADR